MKKLIWLLCLVTSTGGVFTSCSNDDDNSNPPLPEGNKEIVLKNSIGTYEGTSDAKGKFKVILKAENIAFHLNILSDLVNDDKLLEANLKTGKYEVSASNNLYSIKSDSYVLKDNMQLKLASGSLDILRSNDKYTVKGTLVDEKGGEHLLSFDGLIDIEPIYDTVYEVQNGWYWGDNEYDYPNVGEYMTFFTQGEANKYGELEGDGYHISLSMFDVMAPKAWEAKIPNKMYKASNKYELGSFHVATKEQIDSNEYAYSFGKFLHNNKQAGISEDLFITGGAILVKDNAKEQEVRFNIVMENGSRHLGKYVGRVKQGDEFTVSTLKGDRTFANAKVGYIEYKGKSPIAGKENNRWNIYLYTAGLTAYPEYYWAVEGSGEFVRLTIYTDVTQTTSIADGNYIIGDEKAGNAGLGGGTEAGLDWGTWYYELKNDDFTNYAPIKTGNIAFSKVGDVYTIKANGIDDRENKINIDYAGKLTLADSTKKQSSKQRKTSTNLKNKVSGKGKIYDAVKKVKTVHY